MTEGSSTTSQAVVVGVDGSGADRAALIWAADTARAWGIPLRVVHATEYVGDVPSALPGADETGLLDVLREQAGASEAASEAAAEVRERHPDLEVEVVETVGSPAASLLDRQDSARMIVVGSGTKSALERVLLGTTSLSVVAHARCPVVVIHSGVEPPEQGSDEIVLATDGSRDSAAAAVEAFAEAHARGARVRAVTSWYLEVVDGFVVTDPDGAAWRQVTSMRRERAEASLAAARRRYPDVESAVEVLHGPTVSTIAEAAAGADLLVMGSRGAGGFRGKLLGSVTQKVLRASTVPLMVVRAGPAGS